MPPTVCPTVGAPPVTDDDKVLSEYMNSVWVAYLDCYAKLGKIHETVSSWPQGVTASVLPAK